MHQESTAFDYYAAQGAIKYARRILLPLGQKRLGKPAEATVSAIKEISGLDRLDRLGEAILTAASWEDVLATQ